MLRITPEEILLKNTVVSQAPSTLQWLYNFKAQVFNLSALARCVLAARSCCSLLEKGATSGLKCDEAVRAVLQAGKSQRSVYTLLPSKTHSVRVRWGAAGFEEMKAQVLPGLPRL